MYKNKNGFTLIEILVVICIIGILATIGVVVYNGVQRNTKNTERESKMTVVAESLESYYKENGEYPSCNEMSSPDVSTKTLTNTSPETFVDSDEENSDGNSFIEGCGELSSEDEEGFAYIGDEYCIENPDEPCLEYELEYIDYDEDDDISDITGDEIMTDDETLIRVQPFCPIGYIAIPGSKTYNTNSFCVMKYEAKNVGGKAVSQANSLPWTGVTQIEAKSYSKSACDGCHLISEAEWMTIANYIINDDDNWYQYDEASKYLYFGARVDAGPFVATDAEETSGMNRRYYLLPNDNKIVDFAKNVPEWTDGKIKPVDQPGLSSNQATLTLSKAYKNEWGDLKFMAGGLSDISNINPIVTEKGWSHELNKIGYLWSNYNYTGTSQQDLGFARGSGKGDGYGGLFSLYLVPSNTELGPSDAGSSSIGFRVAK